MAEESLFASVEVLPQRLPWQAFDPKVLRRIHDILRDALAGYGSRRVTGEHRMVYKAVGGDLLIAQLRYHY